MVALTRLEHSIFPGSCLYATHPWKLSSTTLISLLIQCLLIVLLFSVFYLQDDFLPTSTSEKIIINFYIFWLLQIKMPLECSGYIDKMIVFWFFFFNFLINVTDIGFIPYWCKQHVLFEYWNITGKYGAIFSEGSVINCELIPSGPRDLLESTFLYFFKTSHNHEEVCYWINSKVHQSLQWTHWWIDSLMYQSGQHHSPLIHPVYQIHKDWTH